MIKPLTSFRFIAALAVFLSHLGIFSKFEDTKWIFDNIFYEGYLGVTFFFILSGFILTYNYHDKFQEINFNAFKKFLKARLARIYPVYVLTFIISIPLLVFIIIEKLTVSVAITNLLMLQSFVPNSSVYFSYNAPSWSISDEMFFYTLFPFVIYFIVKRAKWNLNVKSFVVIFLGYGLATFFVWIMRDSSLAHWLFYISPLFRILDFILGIFLGLWFTKQQVVSSKQFMTMIEIVAMSLVVVAFLFFPYIHQTLRFWGYYQPVMVILIGVFAFQKGYVSNVLSHPKLIYLGEISFSFYMIHQLVIRYAEHVPFLNGHPILFLTVCLSLSLIASDLTYRYYEIPMKDKIKNIKLFSK